MWLKPNGKGRRAFQPQAALSRPAFVFFLTAVSCSAKSEVKISAVSVATACT